MNAADFARRRARILGRFHDSKRRRKVMAALVREARARLVVMGGRVVAWRMPSGQAVCAKLRYRTESAAAVELERIAATAHDGHKVPQRAYQCEICGGWHLTSWRGLPAHLVAQDSHG